VVFGIIERYAIRCQPRRNGLLFAAHAAPGLAGLEARTRFWQARGADVRMFGEAETEELVGSRFYRACSVDYRGGTINPAGYVRGLAHAASGHGALIHIGAPVQELRRADGTWEVRARGGTVRADHVVLATNAYTQAGLWPGLRESIIPFRGYALASAPLSDNLRGSLLRGGQPLTDTRRTHSGMRLNEDGRLHSSTLGPPFAIEGTHDRARLHKRITAVFPQLEGVRWEHRWCGWIAMSQDDYPHLHAPAPGVWAGLGYAGRGIAAATLMGQDIASHILGRPVSETTFPVRDLKGWWMVPFARTLVATGIAMYRLRDALDERRNVRERAGAMARPRVGWLRP
jgi:glycine/D-amino acid oxidase-like deaminating enzyme